MIYQNLLIELKGRIRYITINRESKLNALNKTTLTEIGLAVKEALENPAVGGIIITGAGSKAFVAGADISEFSSLNAAEAFEMAKSGQEIFHKIEHAPKPIIALINGFALGGGLELAMACHIRIATENAKLGLPEVTLGLIPGYGGTQRLTGLVGKGKAMEMILTADMITSAEALRIGLVNHVFDTETGAQKAEEILNRILLRAPLALAGAIAAINSALTQADGFNAELENFSKCFNTLDLNEGISAFLEKRKPEFKGK